ncbi:MAG: YdcF family protein [Nitrospinota bacterium]|nr:YdcF family protein [Nitrospinota bacterium]
MVNTFTKGLSVIAALYLLAVMTYGTWLPLVAQFLVVRSPLPKTDLIVVSTGSYGRFRHAVKLTLNHRAKNLLILGDRRIVTPIPGKSSLDLAEEEALVLGIEKRRLILRHSTSTLVDARVTKNIMKERGFQSFGVVSDGYNMRRLAMVFDHVFDDSSFGLHYLPAEENLNALHPGQWWLHPLEFKYVMMEWIKLPVDFFRLHFLWG